MKVLFNATTNAKGGSAQRAASFVAEAVRDPRGHAWCLALSPAQADVVRGCPSDFDVHVVEGKPSQDRRIRNWLRSLERDFRPDCVYTQLGPAYVRFQAPHLMGVADAWVTNPTWRAWRTLAFPLEWATMLAACAYKAYWLTQAQAYVVETEYTRQALHRWHRKSLDCITVVPNTCGRQYLEARRRDGNCGQDSVARILTFAAPYPHKRLETIPSVARELHRLRSDLDFRFVITLPDGCRELRRIQADATKMGVKPRIENRGVVPVLQGPDLYRQCRACFLPSVLETFSASYPEAMAMEVPMVTTDLPFAHEICGSSALYFRPDDPHDAAVRLLQVLTNETLRDQLIQAGREVLAGYPSAEQQYHLQVDRIESFVRNCRSRCSPFAESQ